MNATQQSNPCGLDGFAFLEFSGPDKSVFEKLFKAMGFQVTAQHQSQDISLYQQGNIQFILNAAKNCQAEEHYKNHGPATCAMGFKVYNAQKAYETAIARGAKPFNDNKDTDHGLFGIQAIGGSVIYFVDEQQQPFAGKWQNLSVTADVLKGNGLELIDHLTHNVFKGNMDAWANFYESIFNFQEIRYFDIEGQMTGLLSRAMGSPCGKIKIPLNESKDDNSQIAEFIDEFKGEGIQHIALTCQDIYQTIHRLRQQGLKFLDVPDTYFEMIKNRISWHQEPVSKLQEERILIDGGKTEAGGLLLQIFTENTFGPVFFEFIQRKGNQGFGEGNFQALFEAIERDQIRRGVLQATS